MKNHQNQKKSPKFAEWVLAHILRDDVWNSPLGDFEEYYKAFASEKGVFKAHIWYWEQILRVLPASCLLITLFVQNELRFDHFHEKAAQIYRVGMKANIGTNSFELADGPSPLAETMVNDFAEVTQATRIFRTRRIYIHCEHKQFKEENFFFADPNIFDVFTIPLIAGDTQFALEQPNSIVITPKIAQKYFGETNALGKVLTGEDGTPYKVTALAKELPANSHFHFDFLASSLSYEPSRDPEWFTDIAHSYIVLDKNADLKVIKAKLPDFTKKYMEPVFEEAFGIPWDKFLESGNYFAFFLQPLLEIHLHSNLGNELGANGNFNTVIIFSAIAFFILMVACINFTNLATARSSKRANEVGVRKVIGSQKKQLIQQFLTESFFLSTLAFSIALVLVQLSLPIFNRMIAKEITFNLLENWFILPSMVGFLAIIGIIAGGYPAFLLASFKPVTVLKGRIQSGARGRWFRNGLVVFQFFTTIALFIGTIVIFNQLHYIRNKNLGFDKDHIIIINNAAKISTKQQAFKNTLKQNANIVNATYSASLPQMSLSGNAYQKEGQEGNQNYILVNIAADHDFLETYRIQMSEGRFFSEDNPSDLSAVILNEAAVKALDIKDPVGQRLFHLGDERTALDIIGVVKNFHLESLHEAIRPMVVTLIQEDTGHYLSIRISPGKIKETLNFIESQWEAFVPDQPVDFVFFDDRFDRLYRSEIQAGKVFSAFALLAIFVACLGLFGLASFMAEQRTKEIGIRKVLGASASSIIFLLSREYAKWVLLANILAWPIAFYGMKKWLGNFAFRGDLTIWPFLIAGGAALLIALFTVSYQSLKAAFADPAKSLRYE
jgi:putative ABC transport system permease protein